MNDPSPLAMIRGGRTAVSPRPVAVPGNVADDVGLGTAKSTSTRN
jgi:hypothetical protein